MPDFVYTNKRGEWVVPLRVFKDLKFEKLCRMLGLDPHKS